MSKFKQKNVLTRELAENQVEMFFEYYDLDEEFTPSAIQVPMQVHRLGLVKAVMRGRLSIEESGSGIKVIQILKNKCAGKERIEYRELDSTAVKASRRADTSEGQLFALMASLGSIPEDALEDLHPNDRRVVTDLGNCFLTV
jgi:hypothetical protein